MISSDECNQVLNYLAQEHAIESWYTATNDTLIKAADKTSEPANSALFFKGLLKIQAIVMTLMQHVIVPDIPVIKQFHKTCLDGFEHLQDSLQARLENDLEKCAALETQAIALMKQSDAEKEKIKTIYKITEKDIQLALLNKTIDLQWMKAILQASL